MKNTISLLIIITCLTMFKPTAYSQTATKAVWGQIFDSASGKPLGGIVVQLVRTFDKLLAKAVLTDSTGHYYFPELKSASYILKASHLNYTTFESLPFSYHQDSAISKNILMLMRAKAMKEVVIRSKKAAITMLGDKIVVDPSNLAGVNSSNALELMKNMPGISVENEERLTLNGSSDVTILIDDRKRTMSLDQAIRVLKTMPATNVKQVEISIGKSARFDAAGSGGIINVVTKKPLENGYNLQFTNSVTLNRYIGHSHNVYFNYKLNKFNIYASASYDRSNSFTEFNSQTSYQLNSGLKQLSDFGDTYSLTKAPNIDLGVDYEINKNHVIGISGSVYNGKTRYLSQLQTAIEDVHYKTIINHNLQRTPETLKSLDLLYTGKLDSLGSKLKIDIGYLSGYANTQPSFTNVYLNEFRQPYLPTTDLLVYLPLDGYQYIFQADLEKQIKGKRQLLTGIKFTTSNVNNHASYDTVKGGLLFRDHRRTDDLTYEEGIAAAYISYRQNLSKKWSSTLGMRYEHTYMKNTSHIIDSTNSRSFHNLFPTIALSYNGKSVKSTISFYRTISRPYYGYLNPYTTYMDDFTIQEGNAQLKPGYTYNLNLSSVYNSFLYIAMGVSSATDMVFLMKRQILDTTLTVIKPENALSYLSAYASLSSSFNFFKNRWAGQLRLYGFIYRNKLDGRFITNELDKRTLGRYVVSTTQSFKIKSDFFVEWAFYYYNRNRSNQVEFGRRYQFDIGLNKKFFSKRMTASVYCTDVFNTMEQDRLRYYNGYESKSWLRYSTQQVRVSLLYNIGKLRKDFHKSTSTKKEATRFKESQ